MSSKYMKRSFKGELWGGKKKSMVFCIVQFTSVGPCSLPDAIILKDIIYISEACENYTNGQ